MGSGKPGSSFEPILPSLVVFPGPPALLLPPTHVSSMQHPLPLHHRTSGCPSGGSGFCHWSENKVVWPQQVLSGMLCSVASLTLTGHFLNHSCIWPMPEYPTASLWTREPSCCPQNFLFCFASSLMHLVKVLCRIFSARQELSTRYHPPTQTSATLAPPRPPGPAPLPLCQAGGRGLAAALEAGKGGGGGRAEVFPQHPLREGAH